MAKLYAVGSNWHIKKHWGTESGKSNGWIPTEEDDVIFDKQSKSMSLKRDAVCRNFYTESDTEANVNFNDFNVHIHGHFSNASVNTVYLGNGNIIINGNFTSLNGTIDATGCGPTISVNNFLCDKSAGNSTLNLGSSVWEVSGTFNISAIKSIDPADSTIVMIGKGRTIITQGQEIGNLEIKSSGSILLVTKLTLNKNLTIASGIFDLNGMDITIKNDLNLQSTLKLKGNEKIEVNGEVAVEGSTVAYYNSNAVAIVTNFPQKTFYNLLLGSSKVHEFDTGEKNEITINGILSTSGTSETRSILRPLNDASEEWIINVKNECDLKDDVDVKFSNAKNGKKIRAIDSIDNGNNKSWIFYTTVESMAQGPIIKILPYRTSVEMVKGNAALNPFKGIFNKELADGSGICNDNSNNIYISDFGSHVIWCIRDGRHPTLFAGQINNAGMQNGISTAALFNHPKDIICDKTGNLYVFDSGNHRIRKVDANGNVSTVSGVNPEIKELSISVSTDDKIYAVGK